MSLFNIRVGEFSLMESGSIISPKGADIHFFIRDLEYVFSFVDLADEKPQIKTKSNNGKKLEIELVNFNDAVGIGNINPLPMGQIDGLDIFIMFRVAQLKEGGKTMHYTWYSRKKIQPENLNNG